MKKLFVILALLGAFCARAAITEPIDLKIFGAKCDGTTDDSTAVQAWLTAAAGKTAYASSGTCIARNVTIASNTNLVCGGAGITTFKLPASSAADAVVIKNSDQTAGNTNIHISRCTVDGNKANQTNSGQKGIHFSKVSSSSITFTEVKNVRGGSASCIEWATAADNTSNANNLVAHNYVHDCGTATTTADGLAIGGVGLRIIGNEANDNSDSGVGLQGLGTTDVVISGNRLTGNTLTAIAAGPGTLGSANSHIAITGNTIRGANAYGIYLQAADNFTISGNTVKITGGVTAVSAINCSGCKDGAITGNTVQAASKHGIELYGVAAVTSSKIAVTGNTILNAQQRGISIDTPATAIMREIIIIGNVVLNNSQAAADTDSGIVIGQSGTTTRIIVNGNFSGDNQGVGTQKYGLAIAGTPSALTITGNQFLGNVTAATNGIVSGHNIQANSGYNPVGGSPITVTASPFTYTAGSSPEMVGIYGGTVSSVTVGGTTFASASPTVVSVSPGESVVVTYTGAPTMNKYIH